MNQALLIKPKRQETKQINVVKQIVNIDKTFISDTRVCSLVNAVTNIGHVTKREQHQIFERLLINNLYKLWPSVIGLHVVSYSLCLGDNKHESLYGKIASYFIDPISCVLCICRLIIRYQINLNKAGNLSK